MNLQIIYDFVQAHYGKGAAIAIVIGLAILAYIFNGDLKALLPSIYGVTSQP